MIPFDQIEQQKATILSAVEGWPEPRLAFRLKPGTWSAAEMFDHLVKTEVAILDATRRGFAAPHRIGLRDRFGVRLVEKIFRSERKVKVPPSARHVLPSVEPELPATTERWSAVRLDLADLLDSTSPDQYKLGVFRHPVAGWMTLPQVVTFFSVHIIHHEFQLTRLAAASKHLQGS